MRTYLQKALIFVAVGAVVFRLFVLGLGVPLEYRVRGDAYGYLAIADRFNNFADVLSYAGERTIGFPAFAYVVKQILEVFSSTVFLLPWINAIGITMLLVHVAAAWIFSAWLRKAGFIKSEVASNFLFIYLATSPALVGHTTSPLTDTLSVDIVMFSVVALSVALRAERMRMYLVLSVSAAALLGLAVLVRPASQIGIAVGLAVCAGVAIWSTRRSKYVIAMAIVGGLLILAPYYINCAEKYGTLCLQSPKTVDVYKSVQEGLRGARILWGKQAETPQSFPMVSDEIMLQNYYRQCQISSIAGVDNRSLTGCLLSQPLALPAFITKKWIGLFDYFRFTPYLENLTPSWLSTLSRAYGAFAWVGLSLFFLGALKLRDARIRVNARAYSAENLDMVFLVTYSMVMLAQHTAIHTEERYGFSLIPLCAAVAVAYAEKLVARYRTSGWRGLVLIMTFVLTTSALFVAQILAWDHTALRMQ